MLSTEPTQFDLKFSLFGIPVRVHPAFWVVGLLLGYQKGDILLTSIWLIILFVSILVHELGHALTARKFGWPPNILLYHFGGLAMFQPSWGWNRKRSILISFAGPAAGFVLYGITLGFHIWLIRAHQGDQPWATRLVDHHWATIAFTIHRLKWVNLYWGLFNLLPVFPLDGGRICYEVLDAGRSRTGLKRTHLIGMITGAAAALFFVNNENFFAGLMFGGIAYDNYRRYERFSSF